MSTTPQSQPAFINENNDTIYYLASDLLLVAAPIRNGVAYLQEGRSITFPTDFDHVVDDAHHAAIQQALLEAWSNNNPAWEATINEARSVTAQLAADAELPDASSAMPSKGTIVSVILNATQINLDQL